MNWSRVAAAARAFVDEVKEAIEDAGDEAADSTDATAGEVDAATRKGVATVASETRRGVAEIAAEVRNGVTRISEAVTRAAEAMTEGGRGAGGAMGSLTMPDREDLYQERLLTDDEKNLAREVFQKTLPYGAIWLSNGLGFGQAPYTIPHPRYWDSYVIHLGPAGFPDATDSSVKILGWPADVAFVHEMAHVWQGQNRWNRFDYMIDSVFAQVARCEPASDYELSDDAEWSDFTAEQQAHLVHDWYQGGMKESDDRFRFIRDNVRTGTP